MATVQKQTSGAASRRILDRIKRWLSWRLIYAAHNLNDTALMHLMAVAVRERGKLLVASDATPQDISDALFIETELPRSDCDEVALAMCRRFTVDWKVL